MAFNKWSSDIDFIILWWEASNNYSPDINKDENIDTEEKSSQEEDIVISENLPLDESFGEEINFIKKSF